MKKVFSFVVLLLAFCCLFGCGGNDYTANNTEFFIGASGPLTGGASVYGIAVNNSVNLAVKEINEAGGLNGKLFKFVMTDDTHDAKKVGANYTQLFEAGMQLSLGCVTSTPCVEFANNAREDNLFFLTPSASSDDVTNGYEKAYQMCFSDSSQGTYAAKYVKENVKNAKIGVFYKSDDNYSDGIFKNFQKEFSKVEQDNIVEVSFTEETAQDFASQIGKLKDCDFIFMPIYYTPAALFMKQAKGIIKDDAIYFGCDGFDGIDSAIEGFDINEIPQEVSYLSHFNASSTTGASYDYIQKYVAQYGKDTLNQFGASAYDCVYALYNAMKYLEDNGTTIDVTISASELSDLIFDVFNDKGFSVSGATGANIKWNANGTVDKNAVKYVIKEATK